MPYCSTCGVRFRGRGSHCVLHTNTYYNNYNYNSDSTNSSGPRFHTDTRPRTRFATNNTSNALVPYPTTTSFNTNTSLAQPLVQTFTTLSHAHAISSLTYSVTPSGAHSLTAAANFDREQCSVCRKWFPDHEKLGYHARDFPVGCEEHGVCLRQEDVQWHGTSERHERCFVRGCASVYRREGGWKSSVIDRHVREWHY
ncbi:hypothetical protein BDW02DRAFT_150323 [Decorospora gaudefroyi]|uniref:Uncharacterized protein n=1 Tax=Decorospora gaudefroyi TaxID=184978 RepID=A0A6A5KSZ7_9PLEO|nr:hypothetical protein BDW02DRAFT_150323 [Decorospora gaudefroyi]